MDLENTDDDYVRSSSRVETRKNWLLIKYDDPSLSQLSVCFNRTRDIFWGDRNLPIRIVNAEIGEVGRDIGTNTHLMTLKLDGRYHYDIAETRLKCQLLCEGVGENRSIETLSFSRFKEHGGEICQFFSTFMENNNNCRRIACHLCYFNREEIKSLASALTRRRVPLQELKLWCCGIDDDLVKLLMMAFMENPTMTPKVLNLGDNRNIGEIGCESIANLLKDPMCRVEDFSLCENTWTDNPSAILLANAFLNNKTLKKINLTGTEITATGFKALLESVCNLTTINSTYNSNHTLQVIKHSVCDWLNETYKLDEILEEDLDLKEYLDWNMNENKKMVARKKVFMKHFIQNFSFTPFEEMKPELLVRVLVFMDRASVENGGVTNDRARNLIILHLLTNNPTKDRNTAKLGPSNSDNDRKRKHD